jgi:methyl-accepting chemotaxis protein
VQLDQSIRSVVSLTKQAKDVSARVTRETEEGGATVQRSIQGLSRIRESITQSTSVVREVGKRAADISSIVDTIDLIAERTNLLSLNASIEAARAGDAGRGFAVVAEEIRNLADRSAKATGDIAAIIRGLQEIIQEAVATSNDGLRVADEAGRLTEDAGSALKKILGGVHETTQFVAQIAVASEEQLAAAQNAVKAVNTTAVQAKQVKAAGTEQNRAVKGVLQSAGNMRKLAHQVTQSVIEQGTGAREVMKAAQSTTKVAAEVRNASREQARASEQMVQAVQSMRRGAASTSRALAEQTTASEQVSRESARVAAMTAKVTRAMKEQTEAASEITRGVEEGRKQADQTARALAEQSRALKTMTVQTQNISKQILLITRANREHSVVAERVFQFVNGLQTGGAQPQRPVEKSLVAQANGKRAPKRKTRRPRP